MPSSVVIVEETSGPKRRVNLVGSALPLQGAGWSGENTLPTQWNAGNVEATQQILGPKELPSDWDFEWRTIRLIAAPAVAYDSGGSPRNITLAAELATLMRDIFRAGQLLRVTWSAETSNGLPFRQVRLGRVGSWDFDFDRPDDLRASVKFVWIGSGIGQAKVSELRSSAQLDASNAAMRASENVARQIIENKMRRNAYAVAQSASQFTLGQLESLVEAPLAFVDSFARTAQAVTNRVKNVGQLIQKVKETPAALASRMLDVANNAVAVSNVTLDTLGRQGPETLSAKTKVSMLVLTASYYSGAQTNADLMAGAYLTLADQARTRRSAMIPSAGTSRRDDQLRIEDSFQVYIPKKGETFAAIAQTFYKDAELADELARANGLPGYTIVAPRGSPLVVPNRRSLDNAARDRV